MLDIISIVAGAVAAALIAIVLFSDLGTIIEETFG